MQTLNVELVMDLSIQVLFYFIIGSAGAFMKDLHEKITQKNKQIRLDKVIIGGAMAAIISLGLGDTWFKDLSLKTMFLVTFIIGVLGFEIFGNITTVSKLRSFIGEISDLKRAVKGEQVYNNSPPNTGAPPKEEAPKSTTETIPEVPIKQVQKSNYFPQDENDIV